MSVPPILFHANNFTVRPDTRDTLIEDMVSIWWEGTDLLLTRSIRQYGDEPYKTLAEILRATADGGELVVRVTANEKGPNRTSLVYRIHYHDVVAQGFTRLDKGSQAPLEELVRLPDATIG